MDQYFNALSIVDSQPYIPLRKLSRYTYGATTETYGNQRYLVKGNHIYTDNITLNEEQIRTYDNAFLSGFNRVMKEVNRDCSDEQRDRNELLYSNILSVCRSKYW